MHSFDSCQFPKLHTVRLLEFGKLKLLFNSIDDTSPATTVHLKRSNIAMHCFTFSVYISNVVLALTFMSFNPSALFL